MMNGLGISLLVFLLLVQIQQLSLLLVQAVGRKLLIEGHSSTIHLEDDKAGETICFDDADE